MSRFDNRYGAAAGQDAVIKRVELKWFDPIRGFGFVAENANSPNDIFLHGSALQRAGNPRVFPGAEMECEVVLGQRGEQVERVIQIYSYGDSSAVGQGGQRQGGDGDERGDRFSPNYGGGYQRQNNRDGGQRDSGPREGGFQQRDNRGPRDNNRFNSNAPRDNAPRQFQQRPRVPEVVPPYYPTGDEQEVTGHLKWFKEMKGFGFAIADGVDQEIFIHRTALLRSGIAAIAPGQRLKMLVRKAERGLEAMLLEILPGSVIMSPAATGNDGPAAEQMPPQAQTALQNDQSQAAASTAGYEGASEGVSSSE